MTTTKRKWSHTTTTKSHLPLHVLIDRSNYDVSNGWRCGYWPGFLYTVLWSAAHFSIISKNIAPNEKLKRMKFIYLLISHQNLIFIFNKIFKCTILWEIIRGINVILFYFFIFFIIYLMCRTHVCAWTIPSAIQQSNSTS